MRDVRLIDLFSTERPLRLVSGQQLDSLHVAYEVFGELNAARDNAVFICHALTGDSHVTRHHPDDALGWWENMVGPGKPIDTDRYQVICANVLGGCSGSTGPLSTATDGRAYGPRFPEVSVTDIVTVHRELLARLGIDRLRAVVGGSFGGMQALDWLLTHPEQADSFLLIATTARQSADNLAWNAIARHAIRSDPAFQDGAYLPGQGPDAGLGTARMIAHLTYLSEALLHRKFSRWPRLAGTRRYDSPVLQGDFAVESYLENQAAKFLRRFDANTYLRLIDAMDRFDAFAKPDRLATVQRPPEVGLFSFANDRLFGPAHSEHILAELGGRGITARHECDHTSDVGHDAFLLEVQPFLSAVRRFLARVDPTESPTVPAQRKNPL